MKKLTFTLLLALMAIFSAQAAKVYLKIGEGQVTAESNLNPAKRNVLDLKNETCKNREKRNVLKNSRTRHFKTTKKQSKTGCFYSF